MIYLGLPFAFNEDFFFDLEVRYMFHVERPSRLQYFYYVSLRSAEWSAEGSVCGRIECRL